jgi:hypothetical protein
VKPQTSSNVRTGLEWGLYFAAVFVVLATPVAVMKGSDLKERYHVTYLGLVSIYLFGGLTGGLVAGLLLPLCRWTVGAMLVGFVAILPVGFLVSLVITPAEKWSEMIPLLPLLGSAIAGPVGTLAIKTGLDRARRH